MKPTLLTHIAQHHGDFTISNSNKMASSRWQTIGISAPLLDLPKTRNRNTNSLRNLGRYCNPEPQYTKKKMSKEMASDLAERNKLKPKCLGWVVTVEVDCYKEKQADFPEGLKNWRCQVSQKVLVRW